MSNSTVVDVPHSEVILNYGFLFVSLLFAAVLFGITVVQACTFFFAHRRDPMGHKAVVATVLTFDLLHLVFIGNSFFSYTVIQPAPGWPHFIWSCKGFYALETVTISLAHCMYALRIWRLAKHDGIIVKVIPCILALLITVSFGLGVVSSMKVGQLANVSEGFGSIFKWNLLNLGFTCLVDISVAMILASTLHRRTTLSWTSSVNILFVAYAVNTGMCTVIFSLASFIAFAVARNSLVFLSFRIALMTVHVNSLLGMFNARYYFRNKAPSTTVFLQAHEASISISKLGEVRATPHLHAKTEARPTINDAGLPLFSKDSLDSERSHPSVVEVRVTTTEDRNVS